MNVFYLWEQEHSLLVEVQDSVQYLKTAGENVCATSTLTSIRDPRVLTGTVVQDMISFASAVNGTAKVDYVVLGGFRPGFDNNFRIVFETPMISNSERRQSSANMSFYTPILSTLRPDGLR